MPPSLRQRIGYEGAKDFTLSAPEGNGDQTY
jgi:hypothetical protein